MRRKAKERETVLAAAEAFACRASIEKRRRTGAGHQGMDNEPEEVSWPVRDIREIQMESIFDLNKSRKLENLIPLASEFIISNIAGLQSY